MKTLAGFIAASGFDGQKKLVDLAQKIDILGSSKQPKSELDAIRGEKTADNWKDDPRLAPIPARPDEGQEASNAAGSFEALMAGWGNGGRPAFDSNPANATNANGDGPS